MGNPRRFDVRGPFDVPMSGEARARHLDRQSLKWFWSEVATGFDAEVGCYVFALRRGPGFLPIYVGKTCRRFRDECFTDRNYRLLHEAMAGESGTLVLFLVVYDRGPGRVNEKVIGNAERFLVETALEKNANLKNRVYTGNDPGFAIQGVHRSRGRSSGSASALKQTLGL